ncbi:hypothetical protein PMAC_002758 [Pneumocystis sp. 'macacae']|nr:hypothetical protein PMAC_002758 [Pneumocystis sp. 'macacae']
MFGPVVSSASEQRHTARLLADSVQAEAAEVAADAAVVVALRRSAQQPAREALHGLHRRSRRCCAADKVVERWASKALVQCSLHVGSGAADRLYGQPMKWRMLRDLRRRAAAAQAEVLRQALRHVVRNTALPAAARTEAQLQLAALPGDTRMARIRNRCIETGRGRGVLRDFRLCRVGSSAAAPLTAQYQFRANALEGRLPGVKKVGRGQWQRLMAGELVVWRSSGAAGAAEAECWCAPNGQCGRASVQQACAKRMPGCAPAIHCARSTHGCSETQQASAGGRRASVGHQSLFLGAAGPRQTGRTRSSAQGSLCSTQGAARGHSRRSEQAEEVPEQRPLCLAEKQWRRTGRTQQRHRDTGKDTPAANALWGGADGEAARLQTALESVCKVREPVQAGRVEIHQEELGDECVQGKGADGAPSAVQLQAGVGVQRGVFEQVGRGREGCSEGNRELFYECDDRTCGLDEPGECSNRAFQEHTERRQEGRQSALGGEAGKCGYGLRSLRDFDAGALVVEYCGEVIEKKEVFCRMDGIYRDAQNYYFLDLSGGQVLDAGLKGNEARFINHSCEPNCRIEKWYVQGVPRIGVFAGEAGLAAGEDITYDYNFRGVGGCLVACLTLAAGLREQSRRFATGGGRLRCLGGADEGDGSLQAPRTKAMVRRAWGSFIMRCHGNPVLKFTSWLFCFALTCICTWIDFGMIQDLEKNIEKQYHYAKGRFCKFAAYHGALVFIDSTYEEIQDDDINFQLRCAPLLEKKKRARVSDQDAVINPFDPPETSLYVQDIGTDYSIILNKYFIVPKHFLLITKEFKQQKDGLVPNDITLTWECLDSMKDRHMAFYNCGFQSGASQPHKHIQFISLKNCGISMLYPDEVPANSTSVNTPWFHPKIPFIHYIFRITSCLPVDLINMFSRLLSLIIEAAQALEMTEISYSFVMTKQWMFMAPRTMESWNYISVNSTGMVGMFLVKSEEELNLVKDTGILKILKQLGISRNVE